jgi:predicted nucleic acid-binding protein
MRLFGDSSAWLAFFDRRQPEHAVLRRTVSELLRQSLVIYVTDYVIDETLTLILARVGHAAAVTSGDWLLRSPMIKVIRVEPAQWDEAWTMFRRYTDKTFSFTDCTSFVVMQQHELIDAFTFDHHFEQMGFRMWPV